MARSAFCSPHYLWRSRENKALFTSTKINSHGWLHRITVKDGTTTKNSLQKHEQLSFTLTVGENLKPGLDGMVHSAESNVTTLLSFEEQILLGLPAKEWCNPNGKHYRKQNYTDLLYSMYVLIFWPQLLRL